MVAKSHLPIRCAALLGLRGSTPALAATVTVTVTGAIDRRGQIVACLWRDKTGFPNCDKTKSAQTKMVRIDSASTVIVFTDAIPGDYAITVAQGNMGGKVGTNFPGIPNEPVGLSNDGGARFGPPKFSATAFRLSRDTAITITLAKP